MPIPSLQLIRKLDAAATASGNRRSHALMSEGGGDTVEQSDNGPFIVIITEDIDPNTFGGFRFTVGGRGSETADGNTYQGFWFADESDDPLPAGTKCFVIWVPSSEPGESGWILTPILCP